jgi:hypothetical protein
MAEGDHWSIAETAETMMSDPGGVQVLMTESEWYESLRKDDVWWEWRIREWALRKIRIVFVFTLDLQLTQNHPSCQFSFYIGPWRMGTNSD